MNEVAPPRVSRRRALVSTAAGLTIAGALIGALWAWLAPPIHRVVALTKSGERVKAYLGNEADHFFIAAFLVVGLVSVLSVVAAVLVHWRYGAIDIASAPVSPEHRVHYVVEAPAVFFGHGPLQIAATILFPAAVAALVYALMAVSTQRDDLGAWPPVEQPLGPPVTAESALPSAQ